VQTIPADLRFFIANAPGANAYPIAGYSWVIVYQQQEDAAKGEALANLLWWMIHDGQRSAAALQYAPLPALIVVKSAGALDDLWQHSHALLHRLIEHSQWKGKRANHDRHSRRENPHENDARALPLHA
jgi:hypothetical protein